MTHAPGPVLLAFALAFAPLLGSCSPPQPAARAQVTLECPGDGVRFEQRDIIPLRAEVRGISHPTVDFTIDGQTIARDAKPPFTATFNAIHTGSFVLQAQARDDDGRSVLSQRLFIHVETHNEEASFLNDAEGSPRVTLISPSLGTVLCHPSPIRFIAQVEQRQAAIARVDFLVDGKSIGVRTAPPFELRWDHPPVGRHSASVIATDTQGRAATSTNVRFRVLDPLAIRTAR